MKASACCVAGRANDQSLIASIIPEMCLRGPFFSKVCRSNERSVDLIYVAHRSVLGRPLERSGNLHGNKQKGKGEIVNREPSSTEIDNCEATTCAHALSKSQ